MAIHIGLGNLAGGMSFYAPYALTKTNYRPAAMASNFYRAQDSPNFYLGHALELGFVVAGLIAVIVLRLSYRRINRLRDEKGVGNLTREQLAKMGDKSPAYRYML
jgi:hypothetical protein